MSAQQATDNISKAGNAIWEWRIAILLFLLFSVNSLCMIILAALAGADWAQIDAQAKFMIYVAVLGNWTGVILAFVSKQAARIKNTGEIIPDDGTQFLTRTRTDIQSRTLKVSSNQPQDAAPPTKE